MPQELQIIRPAEFVRYGAEGQFDPAASKVALARLIRACHKRGIDQALMDLRELQPGPAPVFSIEDLKTLVNTFHEIGFTRRQRLAILYQTDPHHRARLFAAIGEGRGWKVEAFNHYEEALLWLSSGSKPRPKNSKSAGVKKIPVRILKTEPPPARRAASPRRASRQTVDKP